MLRVVGVLSTVTAAAADAGRGGRGTFRIKRSRVERRLCQPLAHLVVIIIYTVESRFFPSLSLFLLRLREEEEECASHTDFSIP